MRIGLFGAACMKVMIQATGVACPKGNLNIY